ncbi:hypothetical protein Bca4012_002531 [Brassica carinata]
MVVLVAARWRSWLYTSVSELALALVDVNSSPKLCELGGVAFLVAVFSPSGSLCGGSAAMER